MFIPRNYPMIFCAAFGLSLICSATRSAEVFTQSANVVQDREYKSALLVAKEVTSADGHWIARRESAALGDAVLGDRIVLKDLRSGVTKVLFDSTPTGQPQLVDKVIPLAFSPDSTTLLFTLGGDTWYYPNDAMTIQADGSALRQLTNSTPAKWLANKSEYTGCAIFTRRQAAPSQY